jgi:hypothetical protein
MHRFAVDIHVNLLVNQSVSLSYMSELGQKIHMDITPYSESYERMNQREQVASRLGHYPVILYSCVVAQSASHLLTLLPLSRIFLPSNWRQKVPSKRRFT